MAANTIGTGALVLTANADKMLSGLDKAGKQAATKAANISDKVSKAANPSSAKGGGFLSGLLGGAFSGGVFGAAAGAGFAVVTKGLHLLVAGFEELETKATGFDRKALFAIRQSFTSIKNAGLSVLQKVFTSLAPAIVNATELFMKLFKRAEPAINAAGSVLEKLSFTVTELAGVFVDFLDDVSAKALGLVGGVSDLSVSMDDFANLAVAGLRQVALGFAYVWDGIKVGTGIVAVVAGIIVKGLAAIVGAVADAVGKLAELGNELPEALRPEWLGRAAETVKGFTDNVQDVGEGMIDRGLGAIQKFGESADVVRGAFDRMDRRLGATKKQIADIITPLDVKLSGAFQKGSTEAYSIVARNQTGNMLAESNAKVQQRLLAQNNALLTQLINTVAGAQIIKPV